MSIIGNKFQFLIGRLSTSARQAADIVKNSFQFLIGRLSTVCRPLNTRSMQRVSIPYR